MKRLTLTLLLLATLAVCIAQTSPLDAYLDNPGPGTFRAAVDSLTRVLELGEEIGQEKLYLMYILDMEAGSLKSGLVASADSLAAGERFGLANALLGMEDYKEAIMIYSGINRDFPNWSCPWRHKGQALYEIQDYVHAEESLTQAIVTNEGHWDAYIWLAKAQKELGKYRDALDNLEKAAKLNPNAEAGDDEAFDVAEIEALTQELRSKLR